jgi:hypothetical protein
MKIRIFDNKNGLLVSVSDVFDYLYEMEQLTETQCRVLKWKANTRIIATLANQYKNGNVSMQINIFKFQDIFICWTDFAYLRSLFSEKQKQNIGIMRLFWSLDSPHDIRTDKKLFTNE